MSSAHDLGRRGEELAAHFLQLCGYVCLARGFRRPGGEIDLIVRRRSRLVFVEVKTRGPGALAPAAAWVDRRQLARLRRMARRWLQENPSPDVAEYRFDIVAIDFGGEGCQTTLQHICGV